MGRQIKNLQKDLETFPPAQSEKDLFVEKMTISSQFNYAFNIILQQLTYEVCLYKKAIHRVCHDELEKLCLKIIEILVLCSLTPCLYSFVASATEQYEKLDLMYKNMEKQYIDLGQYFVFNPKKLSVEEVFGDLNTFKNMFQVGLCL